MLNAELKTGIFSIHHAYFTIHRLSAGSVRCAHAAAAVTCVSCAWRTLPWPPLLTILFLPA